MMRILFPIALFFFVCGNLFSQNLNQVDESGRKQGKWLKTYANGNTRYEGQFRNDRPYGVFMYYAISGEIEAESNFSEDGIIAHTKTFYPDGSVKAEGKYVNQKKDSLWRFYSEIDGKVVAEENYQHGLMEGSSTIYYPESGMPAEITTYQAGLKSGKQVKYYPDGVLMSESNHKEDVLQGAFTSYHPNGKIQISGGYKNGIREGKWSYYDEDGRELTEEQFKEQVKVESIEKNK